jgi:hypothetical protein
MVGDSGLLGIPECGDPRPKQLMFCSYFHGVLAIGMRSPEILNKTRLKTR